MKKLIIAAALLLPTITQADTVFDTHYNCEGKQVTFGLNALTVDNNVYTFLDSSRAAGRHDDGTSYPATAYEFEKGWIMVMADGSNASGLLVHEDSFWYCEAK